MAWVGLNNFQIDICPQSLLIGRCAAYFSRMLDYGDSVTSVALSSSRTGLCVSPNDASLMKSVAPPGLSVAAALSRSPPELLANITLQR